MKSKILYFK